VVQHQRNQNPYHSASACRHLGATCITDESEAEILFSGYFFSVKQLLLRGYFENLDVFVIPNYLTGNICQSFQNSMSALGPNFSFPHF
jgi:hypothetical protein